MSDAPLAHLSAAALERRAYRLRHSGKTCSSCGEVKPLSAFGPDARKPDGLDTRCRECEGARKREARRTV